MRARAAARLRRSRTEVVHSRSETTGGGSDGGRFKVMTNDRDRHGSVNRGQSSLAKRRRFGVAALLLLIACVRGLAEAQDDAELAKKTQNPVADLISVPLQNNVNFGVGPNDDVQYILNVHLRHPVPADRGLEPDLADDRAPDLRAGAGAGGRRGVRARRHPAVAVLLAGEAGEADLGRGADGGSR